MLGSLGQRRVMDCVKRHHMSNLDRPHLVGRHCQGIPVVNRHPRLSARHMADLRMPIAHSPAVNVHGLGYLR